MKRRSVLALPALPAVAVAAGQLTAAAPAQAGAGRSARRGRGGDLSFTPQLEAAGISFRDRGVVRPVERILAARGATYVRLRVWTNPPPGYSDENSALAMARRAKRAGLKTARAALESEGGRADPADDDEPVQKEVRERFDD